MNKPVNRLCPFLLALALLQTALPLEARDAEYRLVKDIAYREGNALTDYMRERCRLDVYYPAGTNGYATVVWFHGGGLTGGAKSVPEGLKEKGIAVVAANYHSLAGLIPCSGQAITHFTIRAERGIGDKQPVVDDLAPLYHVRKDAPPMLLITGDRELELLGRYEENAYLWRMMKVVGHPHTELHELKGCDHGKMVEPGLPLLLQFVTNGGK